MKNVTRSLANSFANTKLMHFMYYVHSDLFSIFRIRNLSPISFDMIASSFLCVVFTIKSITRSVVCSFLRLNNIFNVVKRLQERKKPSQNISQSYNVKNHHGARA